LDYVNEAPMHVRKREAGLTFLELGNESLWRLKEDFEKERQEAAAAWRARREARKPAA
jgi:hypothetical protein